MRSTGRHRSTRQNLGVLGSSLCSFVTVCMNNLLPLVEYKFTSIMGWRGWILGFNHTSMLNSNTFTLARTYRPFFNFSLHLTYPIRQSPVDSVPKMHLTIPCPTFCPISGFLLTELPVSWLDSHHITVREIFLKWRCHYCVYRGVPHCLVQ